MKTHETLGVWECTISHNMEIFCEKPDRSKPVGFRKQLKMLFSTSWEIDGNIHIFLLLIHTIPKTWEKQIPIVRTKYGKQKHSKFNSFLNI